MQRMNGGTGFHPSLQSTHFALTGLTYRYGLWHMLLRRVSDDSQGGRKLSLSHTKKK